MTKSSHPETRILHPRPVSLPVGNRAVIAPIYQTVKFHVGAESPLQDQFVYSRVSNPTVRRLELILADLQKKEDCLVVASGMAAISSTLLGLLSQGDHLISFKDIYKPARLLIRDGLPRFGIQTSFANVRDLSTVEALIRPGVTKAIYFESPTNPHLRVADIQALSQMARSHGILLILDGTFGGLHQHTDLPLDVVVQSLTKFANGHGDVTAGSIAGSASLIQKIRTASGFIGATLDPHAAFLIERGLKTYHMRFERHCQNAQKVAEFLSTHPRIKHVYYPGLKTSENYELGLRQMKQPGGVVSFELDPGVGRALEFCHRVKMIQFAVSLGSTETLISPTKLFFGEDLGEQDCREMGHNDYSVRLAVGLEHPDDIIQELSQMLSAHVGG